jgi:hypothetical protein
MVTGAVAGLAIMPGFFLCVPGLVLVLAPLLVLALLAVAAGLLAGLLVVPVLLVRRIARRPPLTRPYAASVSMR